MILEKTSRSCRRQSHAPSSSYGDIMTSLCHVVNNGHIDRPLSSLAAPIIVRDHQELPDPNRHPLDHKDNDETGPPTTSNYTDLLILFPMGRTDGEASRDPTLDPAAESSYRHPGEIVGTVLSLFAVFTVVGNVLVIVAVARDRYLRSTVTNFFIVSLASADLLIGAIVMPFSITLEITNNRWMFGDDWCDLWHSFDVLASTASILNLSVIALDRYWAITDPIAYPGRMTAGRAFVLVALVWICSAAISFPAIAWWRSVARDPMPPNTCSFTEDSSYLIFSSMVSFYFPVTIILFAYYRIYRAAAEQIRSLKRGSKVMMTSDGVSGEVMTLRIHRGGGRIPASRENCSNFFNTTSFVGCSIQCPSSAAAGAGVALRRKQGRYIPVSVPAFRDSQPSRVISRRWRNFTVSRKLSKVVKEQKAAKTLGIVMGVFCICWVPFFVTNFLFGVCHHLGCVRNADFLFRVFAWLGYLNSGMNPVIYACSMRDFRRAFLRLSCCCCPTYHSRFRSARSRS